MRAVRALHNVLDGDVQEGEDDGGRERPWGDVAPDASWEREEKSRKLKFILVKKLIEVIIRWIEDPGDYVYNKNN